VPSPGERKIRVRDLLTQGSSLPRMPPNFNPGNARDPSTDMADQDLLSGLAAAVWKATSAAGWSIRTSR
jgi:CubicO group peptidase (beta-lactamase class C family)